MTMIQINNAILHVFDQHSGVTVYSKERLDCTQKDVAEYLTKHIDKAFKDSSAIVDVPSSTGYFATKLSQYKNENTSFVDYSIDLCRRIFYYLSQTDNTASIDCVVCDFEKNDERYIGIVEFPNQIGFTHQVAQGENLVRNDIIKYYSILPTPSQKISAFAFVNAETLRARYMDQRRFLDGKDVSIIPNFILECTNSISPKAAVNAVKNIALQLSEQHGKNSAAIVSRTKAFLAENAETSDSLDTVELSHMVFPESDELAEEFVQQIHQQGIPVSIPVERTYAIREGKKHKIKTDTGIEITIPSDFFDNSEYIEFINNPNGTISISIKNVGKIINR